MCIYYLIDDIICRRWQHLWGAVLVWGYSNVCYIDIMYLLISLYNFYFLF